MVKLDYNTKFPILVGQPPMSLIDYVDHIIKNETDDQYDFFDTVNEFIDLVKMPPLYGAIS